MRIFTHVYKKLYYTCLLILCTGIQSIEVHAATIVVTSEDDSGAGTLRDAITNANDGDLIVFAPDVQLITLQSPLPTITQNQLTIDGLATNVFGSSIQPGDCDAIPSPVDNQELFSASIRVTIDGSPIPKNIDGRGIALQVFGNNVTIIGLRIQNFNGRISDTIANAQAIGILGSGVTRTDIPHATSSPFPAVQCCEITTLVSGVDIGIQFNLTADAYGIQNASLVNKCLIQNIKTASSLDRTPFAIGRCSGIENFETATNCVIKNIERGSAIADAPVLPIINSVAGLSASDSTLPHIVIQRCTIQNICGGSFVAIGGARFAFLDSVAGILLDSDDTETITIDDSIVCTVTAGSIEISPSNGFFLIEPVGGIISRQDNPENNTSISNTCVTTVTGYIATVLGDNNLFFNQQIIGIDVRTINSLLYNNVIATITGNTFTIAGTCNQVQPSAVGNPFCIPQTPFTVMGIHILNTLNTTLIGNSIKQVVNSNYTINGIKSNVISSGAAGIHAQGIENGFTTALVDNNYLESITGSDYSLQPDSLYAVQLNGTTGIFVESYVNRISGNTLQNIHEGTMRAPSKKQLTLYGLPSTLDIFTIPPETVPLLPIYTSGITVSGTKNLGTQENTEHNITIKNNNITDVQGSLVQGGSIAFGSYATGIIVRPSVDQVTNCCLESIGVVEHNIITSIKAPSKAAAYGICADGRNLLLESVFLNGQLPVIDSKLIMNANTINALQGTGTIVTTTIPSSLLLSPVCGSDIPIPEETTFFPFLPSEPTSGIFSLFGGLSTISDTTIFDVHAPITRGITMAASSDMCIFGNAIFNTDGPGIFVGGAAANPILVANNGLFPQGIFELLFPSVRNKIYSNSTKDNAGEGIELGTINWNSFFVSAPFIQCQTLQKYGDTATQKGGPVELEVIGNHNQIAPRITRVVCNRNGTITIEATLADPAHPTSKFIIQFFRNSTNTIPHGEQLISNFDDPRFTIITDATGNARKTFTFVPAAEVTAGDIISAHVTLIVDGSIGTAGTEESEDIGDTSEFSMHAATSKDPACHLQKYNTAGPTCYGRRTDHK